MEDELIERFRKWMYVVGMALAVSVALNVAGCAVILGLAGK